MLELFDDAFEQVRQNYVEKPDDKKLIENAINGMMAALGDSYYLDAKSASHTGGLHDERSAPQPMSGFDSPSPMACRGS